MKPPQHPTLVAGAGTMPVAETQNTIGEQAKGVSPVPLRGTQSFVAVMGQIWRRPGLTGLELLWRWGVGVPLLLLAWRAGSRALAGVHPAVGSLDFAEFLLKPGDAVRTLTLALGSVLPPLLPVAYWLAPLAICLWTMASTVGRTVLWRRLDPSLQPRLLVTGTLGSLRLLLLLGFYGLWRWGMAASARYAIIAPSQHGEEPNLVLYTAMIVAVTLLLFMLWSVLIWVVDAAPLFAMASHQNGINGRDPGIAASLHAAFHARALRSKLIETNLVMGIIKVSLLVLAMVFSASPLPFVSVETAAFLRSWWTFVGGLFLVALDMFHVVRRASYLQLFRALVTPGDDTTSHRNPVS
ncbi:MAG: hypothetical protein ACRYFU_16345 [Janthinobacterium lividum]